MRTYLLLIGLLFLGLKTDTAFSQAAPTPPGTVVDYIRATAGIYFGSPSLVILPDGSYLASYDEFGPKSNNEKSPTTHLATSTDRGATWKSLSPLKDITWANLFVHQNAVYLMGVSRKYGDLVIRKSNDNGKTWSAARDGISGLLRTDFEYHTAPVPVVVHNGRIYRAIEVRSPAYGWGANLEAAVLSAPVEADLLKAESWTTSNRLHFDQTWLGSAWLEGNMVVDPAGKLINLLRVHYLEHGGKAAVVHYDEQKNQISFNPAKDFINFPGGCKKFTVRYDEKSKRYWTLSNHIRDFGHNPERTRNCLALCSSPDLKKWTVHEEVLYHSDVEKHGFQYVDWQFDGDDLVALVRTAFDDAYGGADSQHNSNFVIFRRIDKFRDKTGRAVATYANP